MKKLNNVIAIITVFCCLFIFSGCDEGTNNRSDVQNTLELGNTLVENQPTPKDIQWSQQRYNLIRRSYVVSGQPDKATTVPFPYDLSIGYLRLYTHLGVFVDEVLIEGAPTSLNSYLTPDSEYFEKNGSHAEDRYYNAWLPDVDGTYGTNEEGIFYFLADGTYEQWTGLSRYRTTPFPDPPADIKGGE